MQAARCATQRRETRLAEEIAKLIPIHAHEKLVCASDPYRLRLFLSLISSSMAQKLSLASRSRGA